jgi:Na+-translocating ferredoxin:NAD+ oxidoreductase RnfD subunit
MTARSLLTAGRRLPPIVYPKPSDPRLVQIAMLGGFVVLGKLELAFQVAWLQLAVVVLSVCLLDVAFTYCRSRVLLAPASGLISALSLALLLRAPSLWLFALAGAVTVLGKQGIRVRGRHVFNPSNLGLLAALALPWGQGRVASGQWGRSWLTLFLILNLGLFIIYKVRRFHLVAAFALSFAAFGLVRSDLGQSSLAALEVTLASGSFLLFTFFMLTDPQTSPGTVGGRVLYAIAVAGVDAALRLSNVPYSLFLALVLVCAGYAVLRILAGTAPPEPIWQTASTGGAGSG